MGVASSRYASGDRLLYEAALGPDAQPLFPDSMDDEFDDGSFDTGKWSWLDQGGTTAAESAGALVLSLNENVDRMRGITQPAPTAPWEFRAKLLMYTADQRATRIDSHLFAAEDATGGVRTICLHQAGTTTETRGLSYSSPSSTASVWGRSPVSGLGFGARFLYGRLNYDGTDIVGSLSYDGENFVGIESETLGFTPTLVGLGITNGRGSTVLSPFGWFRRTV